MYVLCFHDNCHDCLHCCLFICFPTADAERGLGRYAVDKHWRKEYPEPVKTTPPASKKVTGGDNKPIPPATTFYIPPDTTPAGDY